MPVIISEKSRKFESRQRTILGKVSDKTGFLWPTLCSWLFVLQIEDKFDFCLSAMTPNIFRSAGSQCHLIQEDQEWKNIWKELGSNLGRAIPQVYGTTIIWQIFLSHQTVARRRTFDWPRRKLKHLHRNDHFVFSLNDVLFFLIVSSVVSSVLWWRIVFLQVCIEYCPSIVHLKVVVNSFTTTLAFS